MQTLIFNKISEISSVHLLGDKRVLSVGHDGSFKITNTSDMDVSRSFKVCDLTLSSLAELKSNELYAVSWNIKNDTTTNLNSNNCLLLNTFLTKLLIPIYSSAHGTIICTFSIWTMAPRSLANPFMMMPSVQFSLTNINLFYILDHGIAQSKAGAIKEVLLIQQLR